MGSETYYQLLSLQPTATFAEIKKRYRQLSLHLHPDHGGSEQQMVKLNEAYGVLSNPLTRREYDARILPRPISPPTTSYRATPHTPRRTQKPSAQPMAAPTARDVYEKESFSKAAAQKGSRFWWWLGGGIVASLCFLVYEIMPVMQAPHQNINIGYTASTVPSYPESASLQPTTTSSSNVVNASSSSQNTQTSAQDQPSSSISSLSSVQKTSDSTLAQQLHNQLQQWRHRHQK